MLDLSSQRLVVEGKGRWLGIFVALAPLSSSPTPICDKVSYQPTPEQIAAPLYLAQGELASVDQRITCENSL